MGKNPYKDLKVDPKATNEEIKKAYKKRAMETHPDRGGDEQEFKEVSESYQLLSCPARREQFDKYGTVNDDGYDDAVAEMLSQMFKSDDDDMVVNPWKRLQEYRQNCENTLNELNKKMTTVQRDIDKLEAQEHADEVVLVLQGLAGIVRSIEKPIKRYEIQKTIAEELIMQFERAIQMLEREPAYEYMPSEQASDWMTQIMYKGAGG